MSKRILIIPCDGLGPVLPGRLAAHVSRVFGLEADVGPARPRPPAAYDRKRDQLSSGALLMDLVESRGARRDAREEDILLGVTTADLFVRRLNFVFGEAFPGGRAAVISACRLRPEFYGGAPDETLFFERLAKEAVHELGHVFGLRHCEEEGCIMRFSNSISDTDAKGPGFGQACAAQLERYLREVRN